MSIEILAYEETRLGVLCLRRRELLSRPGMIVTEVTLDHEFLMSSYLKESEQALSRIGIELSKKKALDHKLRVLIGGLGLGYTAAAALESDSVDSVEVVEFLPQVISWMNEGLVPLSNQLNSEPRLSINQGDIYQRLAAPATQAFDLIAIDVDHSPEDVLGEQSKGFYSVAGLEVAKQHLLPGGVLAVWSYAQSTPLLNNMREVFADVQIESVTVMNDLIHEEQTDWLFFGSVR